MARLVSPYWSVAVTCTVVVPMGNTPEGGTCVTTGLGSAKLIAVIVGSATNAPCGESASTTIFAGAVNKGGVVSWTVTVKLPSPELPEASLAVTVTVVVPIGK